MRKSHSISIVLYHSPHYQPYLHSMRLFWCGLEQGMRREVSIYYIFFLLLFDQLYNHILQVFLNCEMGFTLQFIQFAVR